MYFVQRKKIIVIKQCNFVRYFIDISYIGTNYHGWQIQENAISIQQILEKSEEMVEIDKNIFSARWKYYEVNVFSRKFPETS